MMKKLFLLLTLILSGFAKDIYWQKHTHPTVEHGSHGGGHHRVKAKMFQLVGYEGSMNVSELSFTKPDLKAIQGKLSNNIYTVPKSFWGSYHLLRAEVEEAEEIYTAVRYIYKHGKPSKISPEKLIATNKNTLEILPNPLPREHDSYKEDKSYNFLVKLQGELLENFSADLVTSNGTVQTFEGQNGKLTITLPNDFQGVTGRKDRRRTSDFAILISHENYHSSFSAPYYINPKFYYQSRSLGVLTILAGFLLGLVVMTRRKNG